MTDTANGSAADLAAMTAKALGLLASNPAEAEAVARQALAARPGHPHAVVALAAARRLQGDAEGALAAVEPLARAAPQSWAAQYEWALALLALGRSREAFAPLARALSLNPDLGAGWRLMGDLQLFAGELKASQQAYDRHARAMIRDPRLQGVADALIEGRLDVVEGLLRALSPADPNAAVALYLAGEALDRQSRWDEAEGALRECLRRSPGLDQARETLASALFRSGRCGEALDQLDQTLARDPLNTRSRILKAAVLSETGDYAAAAEVTRSLLADFPDLPRGWIVLGHSLRTLGRTEEAVDAYRRALELDPGFTEAWWSLSNLKTYRFTPQERASVEALLARTDLGPEDRSNLLFTLGKADEDETRWGDAFARYAEGNAIQRRHRGYDPRVTTDFVRRSKATFTRGFFTQRKGWGQSARDPIFIVGLPRSGSTLVDQILASHPQVEGTRELQALRAIADFISGPPTPGAPPGYPDQLPDMPREAAAQFGGDYLAMTRAHRRLGRPLFTDKAPWNFMHVGLIQLILPRAKIVDVRRHPLACCLSAFKQHFSEGWEFAFDLTDLGRYYADYVELMAHFDAVLPGRVHRVIYESLVRDTEGEVRRLLDYLELPFDAACLRFFETDRAIATPSSEQVRKPITTEALDHWRNFEPWLDPLKAALGPLVESYAAPPKRM